MNPDRRGYRILHYISRKQGKLLEYYNGISRAEDIYSQCLELNLYTSSGMLSIKVG